MAIDQLLQRESNRRRPEQGGRMGDRIGAAFGAEGFQQPPQLANVRVAGVGIRHQLAAVGIDPAELRRRNIRLKVNTVVTALNAGEDMSDFLLALAPERWKVLQVLPIKGQNDGKVEPLCIDRDAFMKFCRRHQRIRDAGIELVSEDNEEMTGSYAMVDPAGRFFDNVSGRYQYSKSILDVGVEAAWHGVRFDEERFTQRGGRYEWRAEPAAPLVPLRVHGKSITVQPGRSDRLA